MGDSAETPAAFNTESCQTLPGCLVVKDMRDLLNKLEPKKTCVPVWRVCVDA